MSVQDTSSIMIPAVLSPADAEGVRISALEKLESPDQKDGAISVDIEGEALTPCALQLLVGTIRTAERMEKTLEISERGKAALADL